MNLNVSFCDLETVPSEDFSAFFFDSFQCSRQFKLFSDFWAMEVFLTLKKFKSPALNLLHFAEWLLGSRCGERLGHCRQPSASDMPPLHCLRPESELSGLIVTPPQRPQAMPLTAGCGRGTQKETEARAPPHLLLSSGLHLFLLPAWLGRGGRGRGLQCAGAPVATSPGEGKWESVPLNTDCSSLPCSLSLKRELVKVLHQ